MLEDRTLLSGGPLIGGAPLAPTFAAGAAGALAQSVLTPAGSTFATATPISPVASVHGSLPPAAPGAPFSGGFFSFRMTQEGQVTAQVTSGFSLALFNSAGVLLGQNAVVANNVVALPSPLLPATPSGTVYYLEILEQPGGPTNPPPFSLDLFFVPSNVTPVPLPAGTVPAAEAVGDFNGDGHTDIAFADQTNNTVAILLGNGDGTFTTGQTIPVGNVPDALVVGYFSGNHRLDIAVADWADGTVGVLLGNGDGTFTAGQTIRVGQGPDALVAGYFDGGSNLDLAVANELDGTVTILRGNGDGTFEPLRPIAVGGFPRAMAVGDFNGDGRPDLAVVEPFHSTVTVLLGRGAGAFSPLPAVAVSEGIDTVVAADFNGDGHLDLAVADQTHADIEVLLGRGDGTFAPPITTAQVLHHGDSLIAGDFDSANDFPDPSGDKSPDLAESDSRNGVVTLLLGNGDGTFSPGNSFPASPGAIVAADFNGDGRADISVANSLGELVNVLVGNGQGNMTPSQVLTPGARQTQLDVAIDDFNGDGFNDLAVSSQTDSTVTILLGNGQGRFDQGQVLTLPHPTTGFLADYFFGPKAPADLVVAYPNNTVQMLVGKGDGTFMLGQTIPVGRNPVALLAADFNGDHKLDLAVANEAENTITILLGNGDGTFTPGETIHGLDGPTRILRGDFNNDKIPDLAVLNAGNNTVTVLLGNGDGSFRLGSVLQLNTDQHPSLVVGDFTKPGVADIAVANEQGGQVAIYQGRGNGTFSFVETVPVLIHPLVLSAGHFHGKLSSPLQDIAIAGTAGQPGVARFVLLLANGNGNFQKLGLPPLLIGGVPDELRSRQLTGGTYPDLVLGTTAGDVRVLIASTGTSTVVLTPALQQITIAPAAGSRLVPPPSGQGQSGPPESELVLPAAAAPTPPLVISSVIVSPPLLPMLAAPLIVVTEAASVAVAPTSVGAGPGAESAAATVSVGTDDIVSQLDRVAAGPKPDVVLPGFSGLPDVKDVTLELLVGGKAPLPGQAQARYSRRRVGRPEQVAEGATDGSFLHLPVIGLPYAPPTHRSRPAAATIPGRGAPRGAPAPGVGELPNDPGDDAEPSLLERAVADHRLRLGVLAAGTVAGVYGLTVWFGARARAVAPQDEDPPHSSASTRADW